MVEHTHTSSFASFGQETEREGGGGLKLALKVKLIGNRGKV